MRILHLTSKPPSPPVDGMRVASLHLGRWLDHNGAELDLLTYGAAAPGPPYARVHAIPFDVERQYPAVLAAALASGGSYLLRKFDRPAMAAALTGLGPYDEVWIDGAYLAVFVERARALAPTVVLRAHNVEHELLARMAERERGWRRWLLTREARHVRAHEAAAIAAVDRTLAISRRDAELLRALGPGDVGVLEAMIDVDGRARPDVPIRPRSLVTVGHYGWPPNARGVAWLLEHVWPEVRRRHPDATLTLVGREPPAALDGPGVVRAGFVEDVAPHVAGAALFVAPLLEGSGVRIKILEALALEASVLATTVAAEGIAHPGVVRADDPAAWIAAIDAAFAREPSADPSGRDYVRARHDWRQPRTGSAILPA